VKRLPAHRAGAVPSLAPNELDNRVRVTPIDPVKFAVNFLGCSRARIRSADPSLGLEVAFSASV
jgi:hypothetical protein